MKDLNEFFGYPLLELGTHTVTIGLLAKIVLLFISVAGVIYLIKRILFSKGKYNDSRKYSFFQLIKYFVILITFIITLNILGFDLTVLMASFAALLIGVGIGLQNLFSDYMSGILLLFDGSIKVNDIIEVNGTVGKVKFIGLRTTTVTTRDDRYIILPNTNLTRNEIINWTYQDIASRFDVSVGVSYSSDIPLVMKIMKEAAVQQEQILTDPPPFVRFNDYLDSSLLFTVYFWCDEVFRVENIKSNLRIKIYEEFKRNGVSIPFPQRVIHSPDSKT